MNLDKNLLDICQLNIQCMTIGKESNLIKDILSIFPDKIQKITLSSFYNTDLKDKGKLSFPLKNWNDPININFKLVEKTYITEWPEYQIYYKSHGAIGIYDRSLNDIALIENDLSRFRKKLMDEKISVYRIFIFNWNENEILKADIDPNVMNIPNFTSKEKLKEFINIEIQSLISSIIVQFSTEIQKLKTDATTLILFNIKEEKINDFSKMKKRKQGRSSKLMGDLSMMIGCYNDAIVYYNQSLDILKNNSDFLWYGGTLEGISCYLITKYYLNTENEIKEKNSENEINNKLKEAVISFKKTKFSNFEIECNFKLLAFSKRFSTKISFNDNVRNFLENLPVASNEDLIKIYLKIASLFFELRFFRKVALFIRQIALTFFSDNNELAKELYLTLTPYYYLPSFGIFSPKDNRNKRVSPKLQTEFLNEFLSIIGNDNYRKNLIILELLQRFLKDLNFNQQEQHFKSLNLNLTFAPYVYSADLRYFPEIIQLIPILPKENFKINNLGEMKKELFIFEPWKKNKFLLKYPLNETLQIKIIMNNPFSVPLLIDLLFFSTDGVEIMHYPSSIYLIAKANKIEILQKLKPLNTGILKIKGIITKCYNMSHFHEINFKGVSTRYLENSEERNKFEINDSINFQEIEIFEQQPDLKIEFMCQEKELKFLKSQRISIPIILQNISELEISLIKLTCVLEYHYPSFQEFQIDCNDLLPLRQNEYKIVHIKEIDCIEINQNDNAIKYLPQLKENNILKKITINYSYLSDINAKYIKEQTIHKNIQIFDGLEIESFAIYDEYSQDYLNCGVNMFNIISLTEDFFLSISIDNFCEDNLRFEINFFSPYLNKNLSQIQINEKKNIKQIFSFKKLEEGQIISIDDLIQIRWESLDMKAKGILQIKESIETFKNKIFKCPLEIKVNLSGEIIDNKKIIIKQYEQSNVSSNFSFYQLQSDLNLTVSLIIKKNYLPKKRKDKNVLEEVFYEGKKDFNLKIIKNEDNLNGFAITEPLKIMFLNSNTNYNLFYRCVDKINNNVYLYKYPYVIFAEKTSCIPT